jgi:hypothetical protein
VHHYFVPYKKIKNENKLTFYSSAGNLSVIKLPATADWLQAYLSLTADWLEAYWSLTADWLEASRKA